MGERSVAVVCVLLGMNQQVQAVDLEHDDFCDQDMELLADQKRSGTLGICGYPAIRAAASQLRADG